MSKSVSTKGTKLIRQIEKTGLFLADWYSERYGLDGFKPLKALTHYVEKGAALGYRPNPYFDAPFYSTQSGVAEPCLALVHFAEVGWREGLDPSKEFLVKPYMQANPDIADAGVNPLAHFLAYGRHEGRKAITKSFIDPWVPPPGALALKNATIMSQHKNWAIAVSETGLFDAAFYRATYHPHLDEKGMADPALHYAVFGERHGFKPNLFFDPAYYKRGVKRGKPSTLALIDYAGKGWKKGLNPSARFSVNLYREAYAAEIGTDTEPLSHYLQHGEVLGFARFDVSLATTSGDESDDKTTLERMVEIAQTGLFDAAWYVKKSEDLKGEDITPLEHYVRKGVCEGRWPNEYFDDRWYQTCYGAEIGKEMPLLHYARKGCVSGNWPSKTFSPVLYFLLNRDICEGKDNPLLHFLKSKRLGVPRSWPNPAYLGKEGHAYLVLDDAARANARQAILDTGLFDPLWYAEAYAPDLIGGADYVEHFLLFGTGLKCRPNRYFDTQWYADEYANEIDDRHPLVFYAEEGWQRGHNPSREFDERTYLEAYPELEDFDGSMLAHYVQIGRQEGRIVPAPRERKGQSGAVYRAHGGERILGRAMENIVAYDRVPLASKASVFNPDALSIHWVIPDFSAGGGGHMTIFRMISFLERQGHQVTIWINDPDQHKRPEDARETINKHFQFIAADVRFVGSKFAEQASGDAIVATDCWSVWPVMAAANFRERFYFVQDFEPSFFAMGGNYLAAELTYKQELYCLCASPWLAQKLSRDYGRRTAYFYLAADQRLYFPTKPEGQKTETKNAVPRIAFYSRIATDRRAVELGLLALELLAREGVPFHVDFFGNDVPFGDAPFAFTDHGVASTADLAALFNKADIGVVFSATNYSLVPQEMMACGLPIVELDGENTRAIYKPDIVSWAKPDPRAIAEEIRALLADDARQKAQADAALEWVSGFSWKQAAETVEGTIRSAVTEAAAKADAKVVPAAKHTTPKASVVIPTYNAGAQFEAVLDGVLAQHTPWPYEVLVIDSGSTDGTLELIAKRPDVRLHQIDKSEFSHGGTRNLGVELTAGEYIAFLTHDALPANDAWLFNLVEALEATPEAAGAFGKHFAYPNASAFTKRDLDAHFANMLQHPLCVSRDTDMARYRAGDEGWRQFLHFYSDNNSCFRRSVWEKIPYRVVEFGEDQLWAHDIIEAGFAKLYAAQATVYHSHDYDEEETRERASIEASFFKHFWGYDLIASEEVLEREVAALNAGDAAWGRAHNVPEAEIELRLRLNAARLRGYLDGGSADTTKIFKQSQG
ncbi:glycosyltransferase [Kordiimonas sp.]|uniref:rhamnosyltransferase WsaF family glycosyltransferase n=1 Tax=Kordiimonas sp. TaxID=1970157 RepID=UPI003A956C54